MANPVIVPIPASVWVPVLTSVEKFAVYPTEIGKINHLWTYREAGDTAPVNGVLSDAIPIPATGIRRDFGGLPVDVYVSVAGAEAGEVRADEVTSAIGAIWAAIVGAYTVATRSFRTEETDPLSQHFDTFTYTFTNVPNATPAYGYIDMDGFRGLTVHCTNPGGTDTFDVDYEVSDEGSGATDDWVDVTTNGFTLMGGANLQSKHFVALKPELVPKGVRFKITTAGGSDDAAFTFYVKRWY